MTARKADMAVPPPEPKTFDEFFAEHRLTAEERLALVWHLAMYRARKLIETLGPMPKPDMRVLRAYPALTASTKDKP